MQSGIITTNLSISERLPGMKGRAMDDLAFGVAIAGLFVGLGFFFVAFYHHRQTLRNTRTNRRLLANIAGIFAPFVPALLTNEGYKHQLRSVVYLVLAILFF